MLLLTFRAAGNVYAVEARRVVEVVPRVDLRPVPHAPGSLAGLFHYRGTIVPVIDLGLLLGSVACRPGLDTRIVIAAYPAPERPEGRLGLLAERVNDLRSVSEAQRVAPAMPLPDAPYLGPIFRSDDILVQSLDVDRLLSGSLRESLFGEGAGEA